MRKITILLIGLLLFGCQKIPRAYISQNNIEAEPMEDRYCVQTSIGYERSDGMYICAWVVQDYAYNCGEAKMLKNKQLIEAQKLLPQINEKIKTFEMCQ